MFKLFQQHIPLLNIAQAQRRIIIRGLLCAQQRLLAQPQPLTQLLSIAQAQKPIIIQCHSYAQPPTQQHSTAQAADPTIILYHLSALFRLLPHLAVQPILQLSIAVLPGLLTTPGHIIALTL